MIWFFEGNFPPRTMCGPWCENLKWWYASANTRIALAYLLVPVAILLIYRLRRADLRPNRLLVTFFIAIFALCGLGHLWETLALWWAPYRFHALHAEVSSWVSLGGVFLLFRYAHQIALYPSREQWERTALLADSMLLAAGEAIYGVDCHGRCTFANEAAVEVLGYESTDELHGRKMHRMIHHSRSDGSPYPDEDCPIYRAYKTGEVQDVTGEVLFRKNGTSFVSSYTSRPVRSRDGRRIIGAVVTFRDITVQIQREKTISSLLAHKELTQEQLTKLKQLKEQLRDG